eukprot:EG_transcript_30617
MSINELLSALAATTLTFAIGICIGLDLKSAAMSLHVASSATCAFGLGAGAPPLDIALPKLHEFHVQHQRGVVPEVQQAEVVPRPNTGYQIGPWLRTVAAVWCGWVFVSAHLVLAFCRQPRSVEGHLMVSQAAESSQNVKVYDTLIDIVDVDGHAHEADDEVVFKAPPQFDVEKPAETEALMLMGSTNDFGVGARTQPVVDVAALSLTHD